MPENDVFKRYLDAGLAFTQITRAKAEELVKEWVKAGELQRDQAQTRVDDLVDRSRKNSEQFFETIRGEIAKQLAALGVATKKDLADLERRLDSRMKASSATAGASAPAAGAARKAPATKAPAT